MRAVRRHVTDEQPKGASQEQRLERLADALVAKGLEGDVPAIREIGDRLDGKPTQSLSTEEGSSFIIQIVKYDGSDPVTK